MTRLTDAQRERMQDEREREWLRAQSEKSLQHSAEMLVGWIEEALRNGAATYALELPQPKRDGGTAIETYEVQLSGKSPRRATGRRLQKIANDLKPDFPWSPEQLRHRASLVETLEDPSTNLAVKWVSESRRPGVTRTIVLTRETIDELRHLREALSARGRDATPSGARRLADDLEPQWRQVDWSPILAVAADMLSRAKSRRKAGGRPRLIDSGLEDPAADKRAWQLRRQGRTWRDLERRGYGTRKTLLTHWRILGLDRPTN
jgi:hypothetical protein